MTVPILYEDNHLLVVEKPVNLPTQPDESGDPDLLTLLKADLKRRHRKPGEVFLGLVHRLDRPVGGVMVFARTSKAASRLSEQIRSRSFLKTYFAVVKGELPNRVGTLEDFLVKDRSTNRVRIVDGGTPSAKRARLEYRVRQREGNLSLVEIALITGRSHQIRVQFAGIDHPLHGDHKYGDARGTREQLALWSTSVELSHPTLRDRRTFRSCPPRTRPWRLFSPAYFRSASGS